MNLRQTKLTRQELYEKVWSMSCLIIAKEFGVSDVAVAKACRRNNIPLPGLGYWAKVKAGKLVEKVPLPPMEDEKIITFSSSAKEMKFVDDNQATEADRVILSIKQDRNPVNIVRSLKRLHPAVQKTYDSLKISDKDQYSRLKPSKCIDLTVSEKNLPRAIYFMNALANYFQRYGMDIVVAGTDNTYAHAIVLGEKIKFKMYEETYTEQKPFTDAQLIRRTKDRWYNPQPEYEYKTTGSLSFKIDADTHGDGSRKCWSDTEKQKLENFLKQIVTAFIKISVKVRAIRLEREARDREWEERRRVVAEEERKQHEEQERIVRLEKYIAAWSKCENIRIFLCLVRDTALKKYGKIEPGSEMEQWLTWGFNYANKIDPLLMIIG